jgi:hypothetical protein
MGQYGPKRILLVENPQDARYRGYIVSFITLDREDGPPDGGELYEGYTIDQLIQELSDDYDLPRSGWVTIPDQIAGCEDSWIAPVRQARNSRGEAIPSTWEQLVGSEWVRFVL